MGKVEELIKLIETQHNEWKSLSINGLRDASGYKRWVAEIVCKKYRSDNDQINKTPKKNHNNIPKSRDTSTPLDFIDDPDELLLSTAIRELNKPSPDPRWATILINCKKENISTKSEVIEQFKQLPTQTLVNLLSKSSPNES